MKEQMPKRGLNRFGPEPQVEPTLNKKQDNVSSTYGKGMDGYNRRDFRELKKRLRNYRGNASRASNIQSSIFSGDDKTRSKIS